MSISKTLVLALGTICLGASSAQEPTVVESSEGAIGLRQTIHLTAGWNSVCLEVDPFTEKADVLFADTPITTVATYFPLISTVEFIQNPDDALWKDESWGVWHTPDRPESFANTLVRMQGHRPYLIFSESDHTLEIEGRVTTHQIKWKSGAFTFTGLPVRPINPPTFAEFFADSPEHQPFLIYHLVGDTWTRLNPDTEPIRSGTGYWIFTRRGTQYQGPLGLKIRQGETLDRKIDLTGLIDQVDVQLSGAASEAMALTLTDLRPGEVPLSTKRRLLASATDEFTELATTTDLGTLAEGETKTLSILPRRSELTVPSRSTILQFDTESGVRFHLEATVSKQ